MLPQLTGEILGSGAEEMVYQVRALAVRPAGPEFESLSPQESQCGRMSLKPQVAG